MKFERTYVYVALPVIPLNVVSMNVHSNVYNVSESNIPTV